MERAHTARRIARNIGFSALGQSLNLFASVLTLAILGRVLDRDDFGLFNFAFAYISLFGIALETCTQQIVIREIVGEFAKASRVIFASVLLKISFGVLGVAAAMLTGAALHYQPSTMHLLLVASLSILLGPKLPAFRDVLEAYFHAHQDLRIPAVSRIIDGITLLVFTAAAAFLQAPLTGFALAYVISGIPAIILVTVLVGKQLERGNTIPSLEMRTLLHQSFPVFLYLLIGTVYGRFDVLWVQSVLGNAELGSYAAVYRLTEPLSMIPAAFTFAIFPVISQRVTDGDVSSRNRITITTIKLLLTIGIGLTVAALVLGREVLHVLYGGKYGGSFLSLLLLMAGKGFQFVSFFSVALMVSIEKQKLAAMAMMLMLVVNVCTNVMLVTRLGIDGAALARLLSETAGFVIFAALVQRHFGVGISASAGRWAAVALAAGIVYFAGGVVLGNAVLLFLVVGVVGFGLWMTKFFSVEEYRLLRSIIRKT